MSVLCGSASLIQVCLLANSGTFNAFSRVEDSNGMGWGSIGVPRAFELTGATMARCELVGSENLRIVRIEVQHMVDAADGLFDLVCVTIFPPLGWIVVGAYDDELGTQLMTGVAMGGDNELIAVAQAVEEAWRHTMTSKLVDEHNILVIIVVTPESAMFVGHNINRAERASKKKSSAGFASTRRANKEENFGFEVSGRGDHTSDVFESTTITGKSVKMKDSNLLHGNCRIEDKILNGV